MTTAKDVARLAKTSTAVVSYVFNNGPRPVSPQTRQRVLDAARRLNYQPNAVARALSAGRTSSLGLVVPDICNPYFAELARAIEGAARSRSQLLLIGDSAGDPEQEQAHISSFIERKVDAVILVSLDDHPDLTSLNTAGVPVVALHPLSAGLRASSLSIDYVAAAEVATGHLIGHGYQTLGILNGMEDSAGAREHRAGFDRAVAAADHQLTVSTRTSPISRYAAHVVVRDWIAGPDRPRAIYCSTDEQAFGVLFAAWEAGLRVPDDLAVTGFDGTDNSTLSIPPLTTVKQPIEAIAHRAVEILLDRTTHDQPTQEQLQFDLIVRTSCGCRPGLSRPGT